MKIANQLRGFVSKGWTAGEWDLRLVNEVSGVVIDVAFGVLGQRSVWGKGLDEKGDGDSVGSSKSP